MTAIVCLLATATWMQSYTRGVGLVQAGDGAGAEIAIEAALKEHPQEALGIRTAQGTIDYLPHLYLAIARHLQGKVDAARAALAEERSSGLAVRSSVGRPLFEAYSLLLADAAPESDFRKYSKVKGRLPEPDIHKIESEVFARCQLKPGTNPPDAPWYFHYELGMELWKRGDPVRALDAFLEAQSRRADPEREARIYGLWFEDYLPYFQIARAHSALGNWDCARSALAASTARREVGPKDREFEEMSKLAREVASHTTH